MFRIGLHYALRNIMRTPLRSFFTVFSIAMIIGMYTILTLVAGSFSHQVDQAIRAGDVDIIVQSKFSATPLSSSISEKDRIALQQDPDIKSIHAILLNKKRLDKRRIIYVFGISDFRAIAGKLGLTLREGKLPATGKNELLIAKRLMQQKGVHLGDRLRLSETDDYRITGNFDSWISFFNNSVILDLESARTLLHKPNRSSMLFIRLKNPADAEAVIQRINHDHTALNAVKSSDFTGTLGALKSIFYLSDIIALVALIVASAILTNTFLMAVYERTKEIGILNAIGWRKRMILSIFMIESTILALAGGLIGLLVSSALLHYIRQSYENIRFYLPESLDMAHFGYIILISLLIAVVSALLPAYYATRISIARALRDV